MASEGLVQGDSPSGTRCERLMTLYGGMNSDDREAVKAAFQAHPDVSPVRILLATDAASEGLDLQNFCSRLIHYEIPWNPNRMEQRNGRVDRHGQRSPEVKIYHFVGKDYQEQATSGAEGKQYPGRLGESGSGDCRTGGRSNARATGDAGYLQGRAGIGTRAADAEV